MVTTELRFVSICILFSFTLNSVHGWIPYIVLFKILSVSNDRAKLKALLSTLQILESKSYFATTTVLCQIKDILQTPGVRLKSAQLYDIV